jgi:uncharacterized protein
MTRARAEKPTMLRLVLGPDRAPFVDLLGRAPGRGIYVEADRAVLEEALSPKGLGRIFKGKAAELSAETRAELIARTITQLEERILELVTLARRAGQLEIGMDATMRLCRENRVGTTIVAAKDISARSEGELPSGDPNVAVFRAGTKATLGARLGREEVGIVGVRPSVLSERIRIEGVRFQGLVNPPSSSSTNAVERGRVRRRSEGTACRQSEDHD